MNLTLRLRFDQTHRRPPTAQMEAGQSVTAQSVTSRVVTGWFVVGQSADEWLAELARWETPLADARVFVVPTSDRDQTPCGLFVVGASPASGRPTPGTLPYTDVAGRLSIPIDARLDPTVSDAELADLLDANYLWHPQAGLVCLGEARRVSDLVTVPQIVADEWTAAVPGVALNARLVSLEPEYVPSVQEILSEAADDIGSQPLNLEDLPPSPDEPASGATADIGRAIGRGIASIVHWLAGLAPSTASSPTWINSLDDWATERLRQLTSASEAARHRELVRLMTLLENDPDEGLRFAVPFGGGDHRGIAAPSDKLGARDVDFNLDAVRGGGPADFWNIHADMQRQLMERYREVATREIGLGRHRRAAYILATLLNDFSLAARTLEDGGHYREAAALWKERLGRRDLAALALCKGRCWPEAIALYEELHAYETLGDLYTEMERPDDAALAWQRAVDQFLKAGDVVSASRVLEEKLGRLDEAFERLSAAWPESKQAKHCLLAAFKLARMHDRHDAALRLVALAAENSGEPSGVAWLVDMLAHEASTYPEAEVRIRAADHVRLLVSLRLGASPSDDEASSLVTSLARLVPEDRLLPRDGHRYLATKRQRSQVLSKVVLSKIASASGRSDVSPPPRSEVRLPAIQWHAATVGGETIFVAGYRDQELVIMRADWKGTSPEEPTGKKWNVGSHAGRPVVLVAHPLSAKHLFVHVITSKPFSHARWFSPNDSFPEGTAASAHGGITSDAQGAVASDRDAIYVMKAEGSAAVPMLGANSFMGRSLRLFSVGGITLANLPADSRPVRLPLPMAVRGADLVVGVGCNICFLRPGTARFEETPFEIEQITASPPHTRMRLIVAMARGGFVTWGKSPHAPRLAFASEMTSPRVALARDGTLIAVSHDEVEFYATSNDTLRLRTRWRDFGIEPVAVLTSRQTNRFAVLSADGRLVVYDVPSS